MSNNMKLEQMADEAAREAWPSGHDFPEREAFRAGFLAGARHQPQREAVLEEARRVLIQNKRINDAIQTALERGELYISDTGYLAALTTPAPAVSRDEM